MSVVFVWIPVGVFTIILIFVKFWKTIRFQWKFWYFFAVGYLSVFFCIPTTLRRPGNAENNIILSKFISFFISWFGIRYELRGRDYFALDEGSVMLSNHQEMIDNAGFFAYITVLKRFTMVMKRSLSYHPGGLLSHLYGVVFVDRSGGPKAFDNINSYAFAAKEKKFKVSIHPEGTRNFEGFKSQCFLPFKKGPFYAAIAAQIPILPVVISPYYFINHDQRVFGRGRVIYEALPPIATKGMTKHDVDALIFKTRSIMTIKYRMLTEELLSTLPYTHPAFKWLEDVD